MNTGLIRISPVPNRVPPNWHLPWCALWHCVCWLLDEHSILKRDYVCLYVCMYVCMYVCIFVYAKELCM